MRTLSLNFARGVMRACAAHGMPPKVASVILFHAQTAEASPAALAGMLKRAHFLQPLLPDSPGPRLTGEGREQRAGLIKAARSRLQELDGQLARHDIGDPARMSLAVQRNNLQQDLNEVVLQS